jgi:endogenous inhibitor of DNA gyrase (YacG/DUF329 family)
MTEPILATWSLSLDCECPKCGKDVDLLRTDDFWDSGLQACETCTDRSNDLEVSCPECGHEFVVECEY